MWKNTGNVFYKTRAASNTNSCRREISIVFFVLNVEKHQKCFFFFYKTLAVRNTVSKGNINRNNSALAATDKIYVYSLRSECGKTPEMFSIKRVPLVILSQKEISIVAIVRWQQQTRYMCIFFVLNVEKHQKCFP